MPIVIYSLQGLSCLAFGLLKILEEWDRTGMSNMSVENYFGIKTA